MRAAAAQIRLHVGADLLLRSDRVVVEQRLRPHHHAGDAVAALRRLLVEKGLLHRARLAAGAEALDRRDRAAVERGDRRQAGEHRLAVDDDGAGAALAEAAAELGAVQLEIVAQHVEQRRRRIDIERMRNTVDQKGELHARGLLFLMSRTRVSRLDQGGPLA